MTLTPNETGPAVRGLQLQLLSLGYPLPRFGADGHLGQETIAALSAFAMDRGLLPKADDADPRALSPSVLAALERDASHPAPAALAAAPVDLTLAHPGGQWRPRSRRPWSQITGITLHQTAVLLGEEPSRWHSLSAHLGITRGGRAYLVCPLDRIVWHGNGLNAADIGIELDGYFEGIEGNPRTMWQPPGQPREPLQPTAPQIDAARRTIGWLCAEAERQGGRLRYIHAHRQSSNQRQSDPGSRIWREVGLWAQQTLGLTDGGPQFTIGTGLPIPEAWDPSRRGIAY